MHCFPFLRAGCSGLDRAVFNTNLLKLFQNEHVRVHQHNLTGPINEKTVLDWKFSVMDLNGNNLLDKTEYRTMKRLIKKVRRSVEKSKPPHED